MSVVMEIAGQRQVVDSVCFLLYTREILPLAAR